MTKKELSRLYYLRKEIEEQQHRLIELESAVSSCSSKINGLPNGCGFSDKIGNYVAQIADLKLLLELNLRKCFYELERLNRYVNSIDDSLIRQIIICRFEKCMSWQQIGRKIGGNNTGESLRKRLYRYLKYH